MVRSNIFCMVENLTVFFWWVGSFFVWWKKIKFFCVFQLFFVYGNKCAKIDFKAF